MNVAALVARVRAALTDDLRKACYRGSSNPITGHCYVACEALFHATGGRLKPVFVRHEGEPHWFLRSPEGVTVDPTADKFHTPVPYERGVGKGFLTKEPSKRARIVLARMEKAS